jgi:hypothetical protein
MKTVLYRVRKVIYKTDARAVRIFKISKKADVML